MGEKITGVNFYRIGIVVKDAKKTYQQYQKYFDLDETKLEKSNTSYAKLPAGSFTCHGEPCDFNFRAYIFPLGNVEIELIQPLDDKGPYAEFLREHGEGIQHLNVAVDQPEEFRSMMRDEIQAPVLTTGDVPGLSWEYYDSRKTFGTVMELVSDRPFDKKE